MEARPSSSRISPRLSGTTWLWATTMSRASWKRMRGTPVALSTMPPIPGAPGRRRTLSETVQYFLEHRPLDADLHRAEFVRLGVEYVAHVGREDDGAGAT